MNSWADDSLDIEFNDDIIKKFAIIETIQIFIGDCDATDSRGWWVCEQPACTMCYKWNVCMHQPLTGHASLSHAACLYIWTTPPHTTTVLRPFFRDHPREPVPEENFRTLWCKGRLTEADTLTIRLGATPSGLTTAYFHHLPIFFTGRMPFLPPNQQHQSTEGN